MASSIIQTDSDDVIVVLVISKNKKSSLPDDSECAG